MYLVWTLSLVGPPTPKISVVARLRTSGGRRPISHHPLRFMDSRPVAMASGLLTRRCFGPGRLRPPPLSTNDCFIFSSPSFTTPPALSVTFHLSHCPASLAHYFRPSSALFAKPRTYEHSDKIRVRTSRCEDYEEKRRRGDRG